MLLKFNYFFLLILIIIIQTLFFLFLYKETVNRKKQNIFYTYNKNKFINEFIKDLKNILSLFLIYIFVIVAISLKKKFKGNQNKFDLHFFQIPNLLQVYEHNKINIQNYVEKIISFLNFIVYSFLCVYSLYSLY